MCCLTTILLFAERNRQENEDKGSCDLSYPKILYRGLSLPHKLLAEYRQKMKDKEVVVMKGIMSCSFNQLVPLGYAIANEDQDLQGVLFVINFGH